MKDKLQSDLKEALKSKDKVKLNTVRSILSAIQYEEMQKNMALSEEQFLAILKNELKKRKESLEYAEKDNRDEQIKEIQAEILVVESYLPQQLSEEKLKEIFDDIKSSNPDANMGIAMKHLKENFAGQYDGKVASALAKEIF